MARTSDFWRKRKIGERRSTTLHCNLRERSSGYNWLAAPSIQGRDCLGARMLSVAAAEVPMRSLTRSFVSCRISFLLFVAFTLNAVAVCLPAQQPAPSDQNGAAQNGATQADAPPPPQGPPPA